MSGNRWFPLAKSCSYCLPLETRVWSEGLVDGGDREAKDTQTVERGHTETKADNVMINKLILQQALPSHLDL